MVGLPCLAPNRGGLSLGACDAGCVPGPPHVPGPNRGGLSPQYWWHGACDVRFACDVLLLVALGLGALEDLLVHFRRPLIFRSDLGLNCLTVNFDRPRRLVFLDVPEETDAVGWTPVLRPWPIWLLFLERGLRPHLHLLVGLGGLVLEAVLAVRLRRVVSTQTAMATFTDTPAASVSLRIVSHSYEYL